MSRLCNRLTDSHFSKYFKRFNALLSGKIMLAFLGCYYNNITASPWDRLEMNVNS